MNRTVIALSLLVAPSFASADTILGLYAGVNQWHITLEGDVSDGGTPLNLDELGVEDETGTVFWANFEHPIPIIPNLRVMRSQIETQARSIAKRELVFGAARISADVEVFTDMDLSHTDATLYYEILDNWVSVDVGVTGRMFDGYADVRSEIEGQEGRVGLSGVIPMLYLNAQVDFPFSGWNIGAQGNAISYRGDHITDLAAKVGYEFPLTLLLDIGVNLGYRVMSLDTDSIDELFADATLSGAYVELQIHF